MGSWLAGRQPGQQVSWAQGAYSLWLTGGPVWRRRSARLMEGGEGARGRGGGFSIYFSPYRGLLVASGLRFGGTHRTTRAVHRKQVQLRPFS